MPVGNTGKDRFPLLPLHGISVLPGVTAPLRVGRARSATAVEEAMHAGRRLVLLAQKHARRCEPRDSELPAIGTLAEIKHLLRDDGSIRGVTVRGVERVRVVGVDPCPGAPRVRVEPVIADREQTPEIETLRHTVARQYKALSRSGAADAADATLAVEAIKDPGRLADAVAARVLVQADDLQAVLETVPVGERLRRVQRLLGRELWLLEQDRNIHDRVRRDLERSQKEQYLRAQMRAIQRELGESDPAAEARGLRDRVRAAGLPGTVEERALREIQRLERMPAVSAESVVVRNYLDWLLELPWTCASDDPPDLWRAQEILDQDHYGLTEAKERILEYLAARRLAPRARAPILCLVGPPGVGKSSLAGSLARATGRRFIRASLGGVRDEAEIRGHRRTYVGAMPGRLLQGMRRAGRLNPVFLLDEVDKVGRDLRGDAAAALLEALDPEQNRAFGDHYLELAYDLSQVLFVTTANATHTIPPALLDRLELLHLSGYSEHEKRHIARAYLLPRQRAQHGLDPAQISVSRAALDDVIVRYTQEAGVRDLERRLAGLCRKAARRIVGGGRRLRVTRHNLHRLLGRPPYRSEALSYRREVGVATALAWTPAGGELMAVEVSALPGQGRLLLTGQLGEVMRESAQAALSYARSRWRDLGLDAAFYESVDLHVHVPAGAVPKDGPSAGIALAVALVSALTGRPVRPGVALTGEVTVRGRVLSVGALKEKVLAADRAGLDEVVLPAGNGDELERVPAAVRRRLDFVPVNDMDDVLLAVLPAGTERRPSSRPRATAEMGG